MSTTGGIEQLLPLLLLCCMFPLLMRGPSGSQSQGVSTEMDIWFTSLTDQEAFDTVVKATDELREKTVAAAKARKSRFSFLRRGPKERYVVDQNVAPHLYKVTDADEGLISFEFSDAEGGGTQVKVTFGGRTKAFVQNMKTNMPPRKLVAATPAAVPTTCSSCGKPRLPEWQVCPYCGNKYS